MTEIYLVGSKLPITISLQPNETVIWQGQSDMPRARQANQKAARIVAALFSVMMLVLLWFDWRFWWLALPVVLAVKIIGVDAPSQTYVITNQRILSYGKNGLKNQELPWDQVGRFRFSADVSGTGSIVFLPSFTSMRPAIRFFCIPNADQVRQIAEEAKQAAMAGKRVEIN